MKELYTFKVIFSDYTVEHFAACGINAADDLIIPPDGVVGGGGRVMATYGNITPKTPGNLSGDDFADCCAIDGVQAFLQYAMSIVYDLHYHIMAGRTVLHSWVECPQRLPHVDSVTPNRKEVRRPHFSVLVTRQDGIDVVVNVGSRRLLLIKRKHLPRSVRPTLVSHVAVMTAQFVSTTCLEREGSVQVTGKVLFTHSQQMPLIRCLIFIGRCWPAESQRRKNTSAPWHEREQVRAGRRESHTATGV